MNRMSRREEMEKIGEKDTLVIDIGLPVRIGRSRAVLKRPAAIRYTDFFRRKT